MEPGSGKNVILGMDGVQDQVPHRILSDYRLTQTPHYI
jgi:hypothetical protein